MRRKLGLTAVLVVALAVAGYAQKPDFSGTWTPDVDPARSPGRRRRWTRRRRPDDREADGRHPVGRAPGP
jgi:hypothetical protein